MTQTRKPRPTRLQVANWLAARYGDAVHELTPLSGGFWSAAYAYRVGGDAFVLRLSDVADGFIADATAMRFAGPDLPVPTVVETGAALGHQYAISQRHNGRFLEDAPVEQADAVGGTLAALLAALRAVPARPDDPVIWFDPAASAGVTWHRWLRAPLVDHPTAHVSDWRAALARSPRANAAFAACVTHIEALLPACPERRDLIHGDLLHQNVLLSEDAARVTAVFSWKCSARGDFLYDIAWCTFWGPWHPAIAAADIWRRTLAAPDLTPADLLNAAERHHCYEIHIAATHLAWNAWTGNEPQLNAVAAAAERLLARGPRPTSTD